jgi:hypothetical protein
MAKLTDESGLTDEFKIELNPVDGDEEPRSPQLPAIPERPAEKASIADWVSYLIALGADETFLTQRTEHWDTVNNRRGEIPALDKATLIKLADHLEG